MPWRLKRSLRTQSLKILDHALTVSPCHRFAVMLQSGFQVIKHAPHHKPKSHRLWLSKDKLYVWWQNTKDKGPPAAQFLVSDLHIILSYPPERLVETVRIPSCFMLVFDLGQSSGEKQIRRRMVVFETANVETKHLLVDGFRLLKRTTTERERLPGL